MTDSKIWIATEEPGVLRVWGADRLELLQRLSTNDLRPLSRPGTCRWTVFTNVKGRVVDWSLLISRTDDLLVRTSPGRAEALATWINTYTVMEDVGTADCTADYRGLVVQGTDVANVTGAAKPHEGEAVEVGAAIWVAGLAAFGERVEALVPTGELDAQLAAMGERGAETADPKWLERARLEAGVPSPAFEFVDEVNPLELRLKPSVSWDKGCYVGQEVISRLDSYDKVARYLIGFETDADMDESAAGARLVREGGALGKVTSVQAREAGGAIGLAVVKREAACSGEAEVDGVKIRLVDRPFWATP